MRTLCHKACAVIGGIVFLTGVVFVGDSFAVAVAWLTVSVSLLLMGRTFTFQKKQYQP